MGQTGNAELLGGKHAGNAEWLNGRQACNAELIRRVTYGKRRMARQGADV